MFGERTILFLERAAIFIAAFAVVAFAMIALGEWSDQFKDYFFKTGNWENYVILTVFILGISYILRWLLKLVFRIEAGVMPRRK